MAGRKRKLWKKVLLVLLVLGVIFACLHLPLFPVKIKISRETTYIDGPVNPDGTVNYVAYLDAKCAQGVTADNNAAPLLIKAFGPEILHEDVQEETLRRLGMPASEMDIKHFVRWDDRTTKTPTPPSTQPTQPADIALHALMEKTFGQKIAYPEGIDIHDIYDLLLKGLAGPYPDLEPWLKENEAVLQLVKDAALKSRFYMPIISKSHPPTVIDGMIPGLSWERSVSEALSVRALVRLQSGDFDGGWTDVMTIHRLARLLEQGPSLIAQLVAVTFECRAFDVARYGATKVSLSPKQLRKVSEDLATLEPVGRMVESLDQGERCLMLDGTMMISRGKGSPIAGSMLINSVDLDWNEMLRNSNAWCDEMVAVMRKAAGDGRTEAWAALEKKLIGFKTGYTGPTIIAEWIVGIPARKTLTRNVSNLLIAILSPSLNAAVSLQDQARVSLEVEKTAAALALFKAQNGKYPTTLAQLCPTFLKEVPKDLFSGNPLIYRANDFAYIVYSVGRNMRDDGGVFVSTDKEKDDIVAQVGELDAATTRP